MGASKNHDEWKSTKEGQHFMVGKGGKIEGGFGGKYNGKKLSAAFSAKNKEKNGGNAPKGNANTEQKGNGVNTGSKQTESELETGAESRRGNKQHSVTSESSGNGMLGASMLGAAALGAAALGAGALGAKGESEALEEEINNSTEEQEEEESDKELENKDSKSERVKKVKKMRSDSLSLDKTYYTDEGYLVDHPIVTTCGIFEYQNADGSTRRELRLPEYVFEEKSLESYKGKPIIITHDAGEIDKDNVRKEQIGTIMSAGYRDGESVRCEIIIHDVNALNNCGLKELSLGYSLDTEDAPGEYRGEKYDCIQKNIEINHLALVGEARAGETARLNIDSKDDDIQILKGGKQIMYKPKTNGQGRGDGDTPAEELTPEQLEAAIALYRAQQAAAQVSGEGIDGDTPLSEEPAAEKSPIEQVRENIDRRDSETGMTPEDIIAGQKADLDTLLAEIDKLQAASDMNGDSDTDDDVPPAGSNSDSEEGDEPAKTVNADSVDQIIRERMDICRMADKLSLDGIDDLPVSEGRKRIIKAVNPKINLDGKSDIYIKAAYDLAKESFHERKSTDDQRRQILNDKMRSDAKELSNSETARANMIAGRKGGNN